MNFEIKGLEELSKKMDDLAQRAEQLDGSHSVPLPDLLTPTFLANCSKFASAEEMFKASGFKIDSPEDFKAIPDHEWDAFIKNNTSFDGWKQMLDSAVAEWTTKQLGLE